MSDKTTAARDITEFLVGVLPNSLCIYSDGSSLSDHSQSWGFAVFKAGRANYLLLSGSGILNDAEVYDSEIHGALEALDAVVSAGLD